MLIENDGEIRSAWVVVHLVLTRFLNAVCVDRVADIECAVRMYHFAPSKVMFFAEHRSEMIHVILIQNRPKYRECIPKSPLSRDEEKFMRRMIGTCLKLK